MSRHATCETCLYNQGNRCTGEDSRYRGSPVRSWNTCSQHKAQQPSTAELIERLAHLCRGARLAG